MAQCKGTLKLLFSKAFYIKDSGVETEKCYIFSLFCFFSEPGKVSNLNATKIEDTSLTVSWENPEGKFIGFNVTVKFSDKE